MAIKLPNGKIARTIAEQVYKNMQDILFLMNKKDFQILVVEELPEEGSENTLYLVPSDDPEQDNVYTEYIWTGTAFEMVGTTAIDISNMVTTDTNQNIIGEKVFEAPVTFYDNITLTVDAAIEGDVLPKSTDSYDIGSSDYKWKDLYLSGGVKFSRSDTPTTWSLQEISGGTLQLYRDNLGKILFTSTYFQTYSHIPTATNAYDLGNSSYAWKDLYIGGTAYVPIIDSSTILFKINGNSRYYFNDSAIFPANNNLKDLGRNGNTWRNLYLAGDLTDGTNSVNIADLKALIDYAKAQGWIS